MAAESIVPFIFCEIKTTTLFYLSGLFGGYFPLMYDMVVRIRQPKDKRLSIDWEYIFVRGVMLPAAGVLLTGFCVAQSQISGWYAAAYIGATFPVFLEKLATLAPSKVQMPPGA